MSKSKITKTPQKNGVAKLRKRFVVRRALVTKLNIEEMLGLFDSPKGKKADAERLRYNRKIVKTLAKLVENNRTMRFGQLLETSGLYTSQIGVDRPTMLFSQFYTESKHLYGGMRKK